MSDYTGHRVDLTRTTPQQRQAARRAVIWRYLHDGWTLDRLLDTLDALGLADREEP